MADRQASPPGSDASSLAAGDQVRPQLLSRYEIVAPGRLCASGSYAPYGWAFAAAGACLLAIPLVLYLNGRWDDPAWVAVAFGGILTLTGFWIAGMRERLEVSSAGVRDVLSTWTSRSERRAPRAALEAVRLLVRATRSGDERRVQYVAALVVRDAVFPDPLQITARRSEAAARRDAEQIARSLGVRFEDALGDEIVVTGADRLDGPRPAAVEPTGPPPNGVRVGLSAEGPEVVVHGTLRPFGVALAIGVGAMVCAGAILMAVLVGSTLRGGGPAPFVMAAILGLPGLFFLGWGFLARSSDERTRVRATEVVRDELCFGICYRSRRLARAEIESLRVQSRSADGYGLAVVTDRGRLLIGRALDPAGLEWLRAWLSEQL